MSISLYQLTQILEKTGISSSLEKEILIAPKSLTTPPEPNEESKFEELCTSHEEKLCEQEIEEDEDEILGAQNKEEHHAYGSCIEQWFQVSTRLDQFCFCFYFVKLHLQHLISHIFVFVRFHFVKLYVNFFLLLLDVWFQWKFHYT